MTTETIPRFRAWPKIHRLNRTTYITEKIDGTNAQIVVPDDPDEPLRAGSRTRWITPENDNFGFATWVRDNAGQLSAELGPGRHYGEWFGRGIQRGYGLSERYFALFDVERWHPLLNPDAHLELCTVVPVLRVMDSLDTHTVHTTIEILRSNGSIAVPGWLTPEGVVVYHPQSRQAFKVTLDGDDHGKEYGA